MRDNPIIAGVDIGTTKICAIVGELSDDGLEITGLGLSPSRGVRKGVVINIESTVESIKRSVSEASNMAGCEIGSVFVGIAGPHIKSFNSHGIIGLKNGEVGEEDVKKVIEAAKAVAIPMDRDIIHVIPQEFIIDDQDGIKEPRGMSGVRLEAKVHIVTGALSSAQNVVKCVNKAGLDVEEVVLEQLASSEAILNTDEKELGVALIDIGGGTTDIAIFINGAVRYSSVIPLGGNQITNDIAIGLRTSISEAENVKKKFGCTVSSMVDLEEEIEIPEVGSRKMRKLSRQVLAEIIEPRMEEIMILCKRELVKSGVYDLIAAGIVLTGGTSLLKGIDSFAEKIFGLPIRIGSPEGVGGISDMVSSPEYATSVGLLIYGKNRFKKGLDSRRRQGLFSDISKLFGRAKKWFVESF